MVFSYVLNETGYVGSTYLPPYSVIAFNVDLTTDPILQLSISVDYNGSIETLPMISFAGIVPPIDDGTKSGQKKQKSTKFSGGIARATFVWMVKENRWRTDTTHIEYKLSEDTRESTLALCRKIEAEEPLIKARQLLQKQLNEAKREKEDHLAELIELTAKVGLVQAQIDNSSEKCVALETKLNQLTTENVGNTATEAGPLRGFGGRGGRIGFGGGRAGFGGRGGRGRGRA